MFSRFKSALYNAVGVEEDGVPYSSEEQTAQKNTYDAQNRYSLKLSREKHLSYCRPAFLQLSSADEVSVTADHAMRPIICPRSFLPWDTGYAEAVNAGKSKHNEDQGCVHVGYLTRSLACKPPSSSTSKSTAAVTAGVQSRPSDVLTALSDCSSSTQSTLSCVDQNLCDGSVIAVDSVMNGCIDTCIIEEQHGSKSKESCEGATRRNDDKFSDPLHSPAISQVKFDTLNSEVTMNSVNNEDNIFNNSDANHFSIDEASSHATTNMNSPKVADSNCVLDAEMVQTAALNSNATDVSPSGTPHFCPPVPNEKLFVDEGRGRLGVSVPYYYFAVFDGHAGWGAAVYASQHLHHILHTSLSKVSEFIIPDLLKQEVPAWQQLVSVDATSVIVGALEQAFYLMDKKIEQDRHRGGVGGGCTACIALFIMGKLYVANAGDSRATACLHGLPYSMSYDFTPETENYRIRKQGAQRPDLLGGEYTPVEFVRRPLRRELGVSLLCRHPYMARGWVYKKITEEDLKVPLVCGSGKRSRVMATIGVTRGFGDHDLKAQLTNVHIKPFLSCEPEVRVLDLEVEELCDTDVLILATDGLWDIVTNEKAVFTLLQSMSRSLLHFPSSDPSRHKYRYMSAAQDLVMGARGKLSERNWRTSDNKHATIDDIAVFVVPLKPYQEEHRKWKELFEARTTALISGSSPVQQSDVPSSVVLPCDSQTTTAVSLGPASRSGHGNDGDCISARTTNESQLPELNANRDESSPVPVEIHDATPSAKHDVRRCIFDQLESKDSTIGALVQANISKVAANSEVSQRTSESDPSIMLKNECSVTLEHRTTDIINDKSVPSANSSNSALDDSPICTVSTPGLGSAELITRLTLVDSCASDGNASITQISSENASNTQDFVGSTSSVELHDSRSDEQISTRGTNGDTSTIVSPVGEHFTEVKGNPIGETCTAASGAPDDHIDLSSAPVPLSPETPIAGTTPLSTAEDAHNVDQQRPSQAFRN
ncbi:PPM-type phosphatase domain [Trinorchestia longiramus]|nr:PPM-type phosphatase domain [Trinorchestia longiramus]